jgi:hypothetical protein
MKPIAFPTDAHTAVFNATEPSADPIVGLLQRIKEMHERLPVTPRRAAACRQLEAYCYDAEPTDDGTTALREALEDFGLLPAYAERVAQQAQRLCGSTLDPTSDGALAAAAAVLSSFWKEPAGLPQIPRAQGEAPGPVRVILQAKSQPTLWHGFVGPPGSGKTTCICHWLAQSVLLAGCSARVWRLDGARANGAEALSVHAEALGVPVSRSWPGAPDVPPAQVHFVDWPGLDWRDGAGLQEFGRRLQLMPPLQLHLVLNAAYEVSCLLEQIRAFAGLPISDLIFTHLDEETRRGKLWNFVLGTDFAIGFLNARQNVPGDFRAASLTELLPGRFG